MIIIKIITKFRFILNRHQKTRIIQLIILMIAGGFMEMLSVSLMLPFVEMILKPESVMDNSIVTAIMSVLQIHGERSFLVLLTILMIVIYLVKNVFLLVQVTIQERFVAYNSFALCKEIYSSFLNRPYEFFLNAKSGELLRTILDDTGKAFSVLGHLISLAAELIVSVILLATVFVIAPFMTFSLGAILAIVTLFIYRFTKPRLKYYGKKEFEAAARIRQNILQSIQGIKEIKLMRKEDFFQDIFDEDGKIQVRADYMHLLYAMTPRFALEAFAMGGFFLIIAIMIILGKDIESMLPAITGMAMAAMRLLPAMNRISISMASLTYNEPSVDVLVETLESVRNNQLKYSEEQIDNSYVHIDRVDESIEASGISYHYPNSHTDIFTDANVLVYKGQSVGIVGASGSGKSTIVDIMLGLLIPQSGKVSVDGKDIRLDVEGWTSQVGYIPQNIFLLDASIKQNIAFGIPDEKIDEDMVWECLREAALEAYVRGLPDGINTQIGERGIRISGGQRQRIGIARALYLNPKVIVLDEATSALDTETEMAIMDSINLLRGKKTLIIIAHRLSTIEKCDAVYRVENGKITRER